MKKTKKIIQSLIKYLKVSCFNLVMPTDEIHKKLLKRVTERVDKVISADINGYPKPESINNMIPDVVGIIDGEKIIIEIETCDSIDTEHTKEQYTAFSTAGYKFRVYTPKDCSNKALAVAKKWEIKNIAFYYFKDI
ncbi:MAG: hypothetical protein KAI53_00665 [Candidatus Aenigmarchaeota archaeon]|nr:hypothetical protein [Candidatus Aenigmarchaeota archaeon]